jgi:hypothetical protein
VVIQKRHVNPARRIALAVTAVLTLVGIGVMPTPANATIGYARKYMGTASLVNYQVVFDAFLANGNGPMCLDDASGAAGTSHAQANTWDCGAENADLRWTIEPDSTGYGFLLWNNKSAGCLDDWGGATANGSPLKMYGPTCSFSDPNQMWSIWTNGSLSYLASASSTWDGQVVSISGTPANGSLIHMWRSGASPDQNMYI